MYQYYIDVYERFIAGTTNLIDEQACMDVLSSLNTHSTVENLEAVKQDVRRLYNQAITEYHAATTDYGKHKAIKEMAVYAFFLELTRSIDETPTSLK